MPSKWLWGETRLLLLERSLGLAPWESRSAPPWWEARLYYNTSRTSHVYPLGIKPFRTDTLSCVNITSLVNDKSVMSLTYQWFRCWISHYIQKFLAPADNLIPIAVLLCPSMYHGSAEYLPGPASVFSISAFRSLCTSPLDHRHALLNVNSKRCDRQIPPTGAQQPPPFFSTGSPLHDFKDTASIDSPPLQKHLRAS